MPALVTLGSEVLDIDATAGGVGLTPPTDDGGDTIKAVIGPTELAEIRYTTDPGQTVSATVGHLVASGSTIIIWGMPDILSFKAIRTTSTSAAANVSFEG